MDIFTIKDYQKIEDLVTTLDSNLQYLKQREVQGDEASKKSIEIALESLTRLEQKIDRDQSRLFKLAHRFLKLIHFSTKLEKTKDKIENLKSEYNQLNTKENETKKDAVESKNSAVSPAANDELLADLNHHLKSVHTRFKNKTKEMRLLKRKLKQKEFTFKEATESLEQLHEMRKAAEHMGEVIEAFKPLYQGHEKQIRSIQTFEKEQKEALKNIEDLEMDWLRIYDSFSEPEDDQKKRFSRTPDSVSIEDFILLEAEERRLPPVNPLEPPRVTKQMLNSKLPFEAVQGVGIVNGGNTCYLNTALQVIRQVPQFKQLFTTQPQQRQGELNEEFERRQLILQTVTRILTQIETSKKPVEAEEVNLLRHLLFLHREHGVQMVDTETGFADAHEILGRLLQLADYEEKGLSFAAFYDFSQAEKKVIPTGDPNKYDSREELTKPRQMPPSCLMVNPPAHKGAVAMQTLVNEAMDPYESGFELKVKEQTAEGRSQCVEYSNVTKVKQLLMNDEQLPDVLAIKAPQVPGSKVTISKPAIIYPFAKQGRLVGYRLAAVIEHVSGVHYIAHLATEKGIHTFNDSNVSEGRSSIQGDGYYYVRIKNQLEDAHK